MFEITLLGIHSFEAFLIASILLNLLPGPDTFYILGRSMAQGRSVGLASALGISTGAIGHTLAAAIGLSAIIIASPLAFMVCKLVGAMYLIFLGIKMFLQSKQPQNMRNAYSNSHFFQAFKQGFFTNMLNPKVALFFLAFLPQFITKDADNHFLGFLALGLTFVVTSTLWGVLLAFSSSALSNTLRRNPKYLEYLNKITGTLLIGLGIRLAFDKP
ncbi:Leucine efflux protein [Thalassocella blandensis]|nr:Leucine efflux protein [Thalassocella blandensis]